MAILSPNTDTTMQSVATAIGTSRISSTDPVEEVIDDRLTESGIRDVNGQTSDDTFDELEDDDHVVTSGHGSRLEQTVSTGGSTVTGYSAGSGSGSGSD